MPSLRELQRDFGRALLGGPVAGVTSNIVEDGVPAEARLAIYRHHVFATLTSVLRSVYPVVCRLVDERFFDYAADTFIRRYPPAGPCLVEYGAQFPAFLVEFPACRHLEYLGDIARLEWAIHVAHHTVEAVSLAPTTLADLDPERVADITLRFDPSVTLIESPRPIDAIWRAHQTEIEVETVDLAAGGASVLVYRCDDDVRVRSLTRAAHAFHRGLVDGQRLAEAAASAAAQDPGFDLVGALRALFSERIIVGFTLTPSDKEAS